LTATPSNGWVFLNWNGTVTNYTQTGDTNSPLGIRVASSVIYVANFAQVENGFVYTVISPKGTPEAEIIGYNGKKTDNIVVPSVIGGLAVTVIGGGAFWWQHFGKITIPSSVESIEAGSVDAGTLDLSALGDAVGWVVEAGAGAEIGEVLLGVGVSIAAIAYLTDIFENLETVQVTASPDSGGNPSGNGLYTAGTTAYLEADPNHGWRFISWSDGNTDKSHSVPVPNHSVTYTATYIQLSTITSVPNPANAGTASGSGTYDVGISVPLTATASPGWRFSSWNDGNTNSSRIVVVPDQSTTYTATFVQLSSLTCLVNPTNAGTASGSGIYDVGFTVPLVATAYSGWRFTNWNDGTTLNPYPVRVALQDTTYTANFVRASTLTVLANPTNAASVAILPGSYSPGDTNFTLPVSSSNSWMFVGTYDVGAAVTLVAVTNAGWLFVAWSDGTTNNPYPITVPNQDSTYIAQFVELSTVTGVANPTNAGTVKGGGVYAAGTKVWLTAEPTEEEGEEIEWRFIKWNDGTTNNPYQITVPSGDITYTADFQEMVKVEGEADPGYGGSISGNGFYPVNTLVTLTATPFSGWRFAGWFWEDSNTNTPSIVVPAQPVTKPLSYKAEFVQTILVTGLANPTNAGSVAGGKLYDLDDTNITLTATASNNWMFVQWNDGATNNPYTIPPITVTNLISITYTASFAAAATITVSANPNIGGSVTGGGTYLSGTSTPLTAVATNGWRFIAWNDGTTNNPYRITVPATNLTYTANFTASSPPIITTSVSGNTLTLAWPSDHLGWILQAQTNDLISTNWFDLPGTGAANWLAFPINPANPAVFYRLRQP
jgi:hypothetical protein